MIKNLIRASLLAGGIFSVGSSKAEVNLTTHTGTAGGAPFLTIMHLSDVLGEAGVASLQVTDSQTLTNSLITLAEGKIDMSAMPIILPFLLQLGTGPFAGQGAKGAELAANVQALYPYNAGAFGLIALETENITSYNDIAGKTIYNGPPRGAALVNARQAIVLASGLKEGEDYKGVQANWGQLANILVDGSVDGFVVPLTFPAERVTVLQSAGRVNLISTPKDIFESEAYQKVFNVPGNIPMEVKWEDMGYGEGVTLVSEDGVFRGLGTAFVELVRTDMSFDLAKAITATHISTLDKLKAKAPFAPNMGLAQMSAKLSGLCGPSKLKYHPGAVAAWEEAGYKIADCAK
ncbi:MAG: C4-dicarboxylate ABC transporter substrate-binding protein [Proteobacteria bacterium]|nr:C4-dicarboxylate ABC transporter substrate-binding protein [Pseudomonadota bacterium]